MGEAGSTYFTGQDLDSETGLTHFWFRDLSTTQGRWMTPDPAGMAAADPANPQSWNRYAYVMNNPLNATDPLGLYCYFGDGATIGVSGPREIGQECGSDALEAGKPDPNKPPHIDTPPVYVYAEPDPIEAIKSDIAMFISLVKSTWRPTSTNNTLRTIKNIARKVGNYVPTICGGGLFNYGGLRASGDVASVSVSQIRMADTRNGYSEAPFADISFGEGLMGGYGQAVFNSGGKEHFLFGGVGGDVGVTKASVSLFGSHVSGSSIFQNSIGLNGDAGFLALAGGVGVYLNTDSMTSCMNHGNR